MTYVLGVLAVVFLILWRLAVNGRGRWMRAAGVRLTEWGRARAEWSQMVSERDALAKQAAQWAGLVYERDRARELRDQSEVQLIDARRGRDEAWRARNQMMERTRDLQERLTAAEVRISAPLCPCGCGSLASAPAEPIPGNPVCPCGCAPACVSPRACVIKIRAVTAEELAAFSGKISDDTEGWAALRAYRAVPTDPGNPV